MLGYSHCHKAKDTIRALAYAVSIPTTKFTLSMYTISHFEEYTQALLIVLLINQYCHGVFLMI